MQSLNLGNFASKSLKTKTTSFMEKWCSMDWTKSETYAQNGIINKNKNTSDFIYLYVLQFEHLSLKCIFSYLDCFPFTLK